MPNLVMSRMKFTHPCPVEECVSTLVGEIEFKTDGAASLNEHGRPVVHLLPQFPVHWSEATLSHIDAHDRVNQAYPGRVMVVAGTTERARQIGADLGAVQIASARSIRQYGAARGRDLVLVDDSAWPLSDEVQAELVPALLSTGGEIVHHHSLP